MNYPTLEQVEQADRYQLAVWYRFLRSPGDDMNHMNPNYPDHILEQAKIMTRICNRFKEMGSFTPELSKLIGWDRSDYA